MGRKLVRESENPDFENPSESLSLLGHNPVNACRNLAYMKKMNDGRIDLSLIMIVHFAYLGQILSADIFKNRKKSDQTILKDHFPSYARSCRLFIVCQNKNQKNNIIRTPM